MLFVLPVPFLIGYFQYQGTFRTHRIGSRNAGILLILANLPLIGLLVAMLQVNGDSEISIALLFLGLICLNIYTAILNFRWARQLKLLPKKKRAGYSLRELFAFVTVVVCTTGLVTFFACSGFPQYQEHVSPSQTPYHLPPNASDVSYAQGSRGTERYEFNIDEAGFIAWVNSGIGSHESNDAKIPVQEITTPFTITRYTASFSGHSDPTDITITNGLFYAWSESDKGVYAGYDRTTGRAYYSCHFY